MDLLAITRKLNRELQPLVFGPPVTHVYNPLEYAWKPHRAYLERYGQGPREVLLLGMNPGPWGMAQTGVPFGEIESVRGWLGIEAKVDKPQKEHPKRPIQGFDCPRSEVSGRRIWGWAKDTFDTPSAFFRRFFIANYCPLTFMEESGKNRTPDKLSADERAQVLRICDRALRRVAEHFRPQWVVGVGAFAEARALASLEGLDVKVARILHPSPANPAANRGWAEAATQQLNALGIFP